MLQTASILGAALGQTTLRHPSAPGLVDHAVEEAETPRADDARTRELELASISAAADVAVSHAGLVAAVGVHLDRSLGLTYAAVRRAAPVPMLVLVLGVAISCVFAGALLMAFFFESSQEVDEKAKAADGYGYQRGQSSAGARPRSVTPPPQQGGARARSLTPPPPQHPGGLPALSHRSPGASPAVSGRQARQLCPGLVVPRGSECLLAVPATPMVLGDTTSFQVRDLGGKPVITVDLSRPGPPAGSTSPSGSRAIAVLRAAAPPGKTGPSPALASCRASQGPGGEQSVFVLNGRQEVFATVTKVSARGYLLAGAQGSNPQLQFEGDFANHAATISQREEGAGVGQLLAETEPAAMAFDQEGSYYRLRVCSGADVGLLLCGLLAVGHFEAR